MNRYVFFKSVRTYLPDNFKILLKAVRDYGFRALYQGIERLCPICMKSARRFRPTGRPMRTDAKCVHCTALERHRMLWVFIQRSTNLLNGSPKKLLHIAPEPCLESRLRNMFGMSYVTADLSSNKVNLKFDIIQLPHPDNSFDVVLCSHVFEHIPNDRAAMREIKRVLKPDGWAILLVPITVDHTIEDASITDPTERLRLFGQEDHVRRYGPDYIDRLRDAGFHVRVIRSHDFATNSEIVQFGLTRASGEIYYCT
ncbi:class I SAM-dependent methyltransferase [Candidatus Viridilinea mediisalina]|uniref:Methyltransferase type 11 n=1 Tax=Candidatus Viridilinea mediisalina TaxID=2024553 RepID=A0A2A6RL64_9CHLR|nr:class I SAM-dependent methyltransferase [Candidatus Viridilinea mediisalina]PDW03608.1 methyltransferase type 11 [Candidatus Viridilinea mediisalina]